MMFKTLRKNRCSSLIISLFCLIPQFLYAASLNNTEENKARMKEMLATDHVPFTKAERWAIFYGLREGSRGLYDEGKFKYEAIEPLLEMNDVDALVIFAKKAMSANGIPSDGEQDFKKGTQLYLKAAGLGHVESMHSIGELYLKGDQRTSYGIARDERKAVEWLIKYDDCFPAIENRELIASLYKGEHPYLTGKSLMKPNLIKSLEWKKKAKKLEKQLVAKRLKEINLEEEIADRKRSNPEVSKREIKKAIMDDISFHVRTSVHDKSPHQRKQELEKRLTAGAGDKNEIMKRFWVYKFQKYMDRIEDGDLEAAEELAEFFMHGHVMFKRDLVHAVEFYRKAGDAGNASAMAKAGSILVFDESTARDPVLGLELLHQAYKMEPNYYLRVGVLGSIQKAYKEGPEEIRSVELAEKWTKRRKEEDDRVRKGGQSMINKKWEESPNP